MIETLIDTPDNYEVVRDKLYSIIEAEQANQVLLADAAGKPDPQDWALRVFRERGGNPWSIWDESETEFTPIVNVRFDSYNSIDDASPNSRSFLNDGDFRIDIFCGARATEDNPDADKQASLCTDKAIGYVRKIIKASRYAYLELPKIVSRVWVQNVVKGKPQADIVGTYSVFACEMTVRVRVAESSPQNAPEILNSLNVTANRESDGTTLFEADFNYT